MFPRNSTGCALPVMCLTLAAGFSSVAQTAPCPLSRTITGITWEWKTWQCAALGSDLWPVTWVPDDNLYVAWGDGGGFGGSDSDGRVSMGFGRIEGGPEHFHGFNINGGKAPQHPASFPKAGKTGALLFDHGILFANVNLQDGPWPNVNHVLAWSSNNGASWTKSDCVFPRGAGNFQPARFLNFGKDGFGAPPGLSGYIYMYGVKQGLDDNVYLARASSGKVPARDDFSFFAGLDARGHCKWEHGFNKARPVFSDTNGVAVGGAVYNPALRCFLLTSFHTGPGQLGVFESSHPWGPWFTVAYYNDWAGMGTQGEGLTCEFPRKWMGADGLTLWAIFSAYGEGAKQGIHAHDCFNLVKVVLSR